MIKENIILRTELNGKKATENEYWIDTENNAIFTIINTNDYCGDMGVTTFMVDLLNHESEYYGFRVETLLSMNVGQRHLSYGDGDSVQVIRIA